MNKEVIQWDYKGFKYGDFGGFEDATNELKKLGKQGWEATANITDGKILLKRPVGVINMELEETVVRKPNRDEVFSSNRSNLNLSFF